MSRLPKSPPRESIVPRYGEAVSGRSGIPGLSILFYKSEECGVSTCLLAYVRDALKDTWIEQGWTERAMI